MEDYILFILIGIVIAVIYVVNKISNDIIDEKKNVLKIKKELDIYLQIRNIILR
jgi:flagellar biogenesis protein FliO